VSTYIHTYNTWIFYNITYQLSTEIMKTDILITDFLLIVAYELTTSFIKAKRRHPKKAIHS
jgi:hypothetical protein